jgi:hypothetical protein
METWKDIIGFEGVYQVSDLGNVKSLKRYVSNGHALIEIKEKLLTKKLTKNGYLAVTFRHYEHFSTPLIHRLVAAAFHENPEKKPQVNHKNGIKIDNRKQNLEWITSMENCCHREKLNKKTSSFTDVHWDKKDRKWKAYIRFKSKLNYLGSFDNELSAYNARVSFENNNSITNKYI